MMEEIAHVGRREPGNLGNLSVTLPLLNFQKHEFPVARLQRSDRPMNALTCLLAFESRFRGRLGWDRSRR